MARAKVRFNVNHAVSVMRRSTDEGIRDAMSTILQEAKDEAPMDTGALRESGRLVQSPASTKIIFEAPYAEIQHENLHYAHKIGKAKYLEDPFLRNVGLLYETVQRQVNKDFGTD